MRRTVGLAIALAIAATLTAGSNAIAAAPSGWAHGPGSMSADARYLAFSSGADDVVPGVTGDQVYVRDLDTGATVVATRADGPDGAVAIHPPDTATLAGGVISADGGLVVFQTTADNIVPGLSGPPHYHLYARDLRRGRTYLVSRQDGHDGAPFGYATGFTVSADGRYVAFRAQEWLPPAGGFEAPTNVYLRDLIGGRTVLVSRADGPDGAPVNGYVSVRPLGISPGGRYVTFVSTRSLDGEPPNHHIYMRDIRLGRTILVSRADGPGGAPAAEIGATAAPVLADGCHVAFAAAGGLVPELAPTTGPQAYLRNLCTHTTTLASLTDGPAGAPAMSPPIDTGPNSYVVVDGLSPDGRYVTFWTASPNFSGLPPTNRTQHLYMRDLVEQRTTAVGDGPRPLPTGPAIQNPLDDPGIGPPADPEPEDPVEEAPPPEPDHPQPGGGDPPPPGPALAVPGRAKSAPRVTVVRLRGRVVALRISRPGRVVVRVQRRVVGRRWRIVARRSRRVASTTVARVRLPALPGGRYRVSIRASGAGRVGPWVTRRMKLPEPAKERRG